MSIKFENTEVLGWDHAIRGMRNPMNSWEMSDSEYGCVEGMYKKVEDARELNHCCVCESGHTETCPDCFTHFVIGPNDLSLMKKLRNAGTDHRKFMRMITVYVDITGPLYFWKEFDTYKIGTVANSCSTMHKIHAKEFTLEDFSCEHLIGRDSEWEDTFDLFNDEGVNSVCCPTEFFKMTCGILNFYRKKYLETKDKKYWWQMIQLLPSSYNQKRTVILNYEVLANMYKSRKNHKLNEWLEFCSWIETLPYSELITGARDKQNEVKRGE